MPIDRKGCWFAGALAAACFVSDAAAASSGRLDVGEALRQVVERALPGGDAFRRAIPARPVQGLVPLSGFRGSSGAATPELPGMPDLPAPLADRDTWPVEAVFVDAEDRLWFAVGEEGDYALHRMAWGMSNVRAAAACLVALLVVVACWRIRRSVRRRARLRRIDARRVQAENASRAKSRFLATLGHEVRTPMTGMLGMSELLMETPLDARQRRYVESILRAGGHLLALLDDAIDVAGIEEGRLAIATEDVDLRALVDDIARQAAPLAERKGLRFRCEVADAAPHAVLGDPVRLRQVVINLVSNALKFTVRGGVVLHVGRLGRGGICLRVSDTGPGMDAAQRARLFTRFVQVGKGEAGDRRGKGLGLAISRELVEAMGGAIRVESTPGRGSCFVVELPLATPASDADAPVRAGFSPWRRGSRATVSGKAG